MNFNPQNILKGLLFSLFISINILGTLAAPTGKYCLIIEFKDGKTQKFQLSTRPNMTFQGDQFVVAQGSSNVEFSFSDVAGFSFGDKNSSGMNTLRDNNLSFSYIDNQYFVIYGGNGMTSVEVISTDGKRQPCNVSRLEGNALSVSLSNLRSGVYLVKVNNKDVFKIVRK